MASDLPSDAPRIVTQYLADRKIVIADASSGARSTIAQVLKTLGARTSNLVLVGSYERAYTEIGRQMPQMIICDYNLGDHCGLRLLEQQRSFVPDPRESIFMLVTANSGESAIAEAAEEDVDCYLLKPFTMESLNERIFRTIYAKLRPSPYRQQIEQGKAHLALREADEAISCFEKAMTLSQMPTLAHYYSGQARVLKKQLDQAEFEYHRGLEMMEYHYRCMTGLFELHLLQNRHKDAYGVARKFAQVFPLSAQKLDQILRLAVRTNVFVDIDFYYDIYKGLDYRTADLTRCMMAALLVAGKHSLSQKMVPKAVERFKKAIITGGRALPLLREIIQALVAKGACAEAEEFLREFPPENQSDPIFHAMDLLIQDGLAADHPGAVIEKGRRLLEKGVADPLVYEILIRRSSQAGLDDSAEHLAFEAARLWPEAKERYFSLLKRPVTAD